MLTDNTSPHSFSAEDIFGIVQGLAVQATDEQLAALEDTKIANLTDVPIKRGATSAILPTINFADSIRVDDDSETPLQFIYEAADCRMFRTKEMLQDVTVMWHAVAKVMNGEYDACVKDSMGHGSDDDGDGIGDIVEEGANNSTSGGDGSSSSGGDGPSTGSADDTEPPLSENGAEGLGMLAGSLFNIVLIATVMGLLALI